MSVPTFTPAVYADHKRKDGSYNVKIRVTFKRQSRRLPSTIFVTPQDLTRSLKIKNSAKADALAELCRRMRRTLDGLTIFELEEMTIDELVAHVRKRMNAGSDFRLDFIEYARKYIETAPISEGSLSNYKSAINNLDEYTGHRGLDISELTSSFLHRFEESERARLDAKKGGGKGHGCLHNYFCIYQKIHRAARLEYNDDELDIIRIRNPFEYYTAPTPPPARHRDVPLDYLRTMYAERTTLAGRERLGVDLFLLSFALIGINEADLYEVELLPGSKDVLRYYRRKTRSVRSDRAEMRIRLEPLAVEIGKDYIKKGGPEFYRLSGLYSRRVHLTGAINIGLAAWAKRHRVEPFTFYAARHTWATTAAAIGIQESTITAALDHIDTARRTDNIYIRRGWQPVWDANAAVLAHVFGTDCAQ